MNIQTMSWHQLAKLATDQQSIISQQTAEIVEYKKHATDFEEMYKQEHRVKNQLKVEIERNKQGWSVMALMPMIAHPGEVREFARKMLKGETPYKLNESEEVPNVNP